MGRLLIAAALLSVIAGGLISFGVARPLLAQDAAAGRPQLAQIQHGG